MLKTLAVRMKIIAQCKMSCEKNSAQKLRKIDSIKCLEFPLQNDVEINPQAYPVTGI